MRTTRFEIFQTGLVLLGLCFLSIDVALGLSYTICVSAVSASLLENLFIIGNIKLWLLTLVVLCQAMENNEEMKFKTRKGFSEEPVAPDKVQFPLGLVEKS